MYSYLIPGVILNFWFKLKICSENKEILIYKPSHISAETLTGFILLKYSNNVADEVLKRLDLTKE